MSQPDLPPKPHQRPEPGEALLGPRKRRRRHRIEVAEDPPIVAATPRSADDDAASASPARRGRHRTSGRRKHRSKVLAWAAAGSTALVILLIGLSLWLWNRPPPELIPTAGLDEILNAPRSGDWRWRRLRENTAVLVLEFPTLAQQGSAMNRIAAYLEKTGGARDRLLDDAELASLIKSSGDNASTFYLGHDYSLDRLGQFFSQAATQKLSLNPQERQLLDQLIKWDILKRELDGSLHSTAERALVSFTATQEDDPATPEDETVDAVRRESVLRHELSHGEFFTNSDYRQQCWEFWRRGLTEAQRQMFRNYLAGIDYDPKNEELMVNETQAMLMHTPDTRAFNAGDLGLNEIELERLRVRFRAAR